jgi:hypothetical protein
MAEKWFAIVRKSNGTLYSVGTVVADPLPAEFHALPLEEQPDLGKVTWDPPTLAFRPTSGVTVTDRKISRIRSELGPRFSTDEKDYIEKLVRAQYE